MEKMTWTKPAAIVEQFMPNEYIAKCSDTTEEYWSFKCDARGGIFGAVGYDGNNNGYKAWEAILGIDKVVDEYYACGKEHRVKKTSNSLPAEFRDGFYLSALDGNDTLFDPVVVWLENGRVHVTRQMRNDIKVVTGNRS